MGCMILCSYSKNANPEKSSCILLNVNPNNNQNKTDLNSGCVNYNYEKDKNNNTSSFMGNDKTINNLDYSFTPANYPLMNIVNLKFK